MVELKVTEQRYKEANVGDHIMIGMTIAIMLAVNPNFLPDSSDMHKPQACSNGVLGISFSHIKLGLNIVYRGSLGNR